MKIPTIKQRKVWGAIILEVLGTIMAFALDASFGEWSTFSLLNFSIFLGGNSLDKYQHLKHKKDEVPLN